MRYKNIKVTTCMMISAAMLTAGVVPAMAGETTLQPEANLIGTVQEVSEEDTADLSEVAQSVQEISEEKAEEYASLGVAQVDSYLNVREAADQNSDIVGRMENDSVATVVGESGDWYEIQSGDITGYVAKQYLTVGDTSLIDSVKDEETGDFTYATEQVNTGESVIEYALQFVGNPYVYGGCSLTNGTDCSGFVMSVYANFGVSLPHSSSALRSVGTEVSYSDAQPGDIICYSGHVALYIGNGQIVHASTPSEGIKVSSATYKSIITVRRIFN